MLPSPVAPTDSEAIATTMVGVDSKTPGFHLLLHRKLSDWLSPLRNGQAVTRLFCHTLLFVSFFLTSSHLASLTFCLSGFLTF